MSLTSAVGPPRRIKVPTRGRLYAVVLFASLVATWILAVRSVGSGVEPPLDPELHAAVLLASSAAAMLLWLNPQRHWYASGILTLLGSYTCFWLASPEGSLLISQILRNHMYAVRGAGIAGAVVLLLFPVSWVLLARSVASLKVGVITYLIAGAGFLVACLSAPILPLPGSQASAPLSIYVLLTLAWPHQTLVMLGVFGWTVA